MPGRGEGPQAVEGEHDDGQAHLQVGTREKLGSLLILAGVAVIVGIAVVIIIAVITT